MELPPHLGDKEVHSFLGSSSSCILHSLPCPQRECIDVPVDGQHCTVDFIGLTDLMSPLAEEVVGGLLTLFHSTVDPF